MTTTTPQPGPDAPAASAGPPAKPLSPPDAQRAALRDLVGLSAESAATETRLDRELAAALHAAAENLEKSGKSIRNRLSNLREQVRQKHEQTLAEVAARHAADMDAVAQAEEPARRRADAELEQVEQVVDKKVREAAWLAESDLEVAVNTLAAEEKKLADEAAAGRDQLAAVEQELIKRATTFGHRPAADELLPGLATDAPDGGEPAGDDGVKAAAATVTPAATVADTAAAIATAQQAFDAAADRLRGLRAPQLFVGATPYLILLVLVALAGGAAWAATGLDAPNVAAIAGAAVVTAIVAVAIGVVLKKQAKQQVRLAFADVETSLGETRRAIAAHLAAAAAVREKTRARAAHRKETETRFARERFAPGLTNAQRKHEAALAAIAERGAAARAAADAARDLALAAAEAWLQKATREVDNRLDLDLQGAKAHHDQLVAQARRRYDESRAALEQRLRDGLKTLRAPIAASASTGHTAPLDWESPAWADWKPPTRFAPGVRFGTLHVDLMKIAREAAGHGTPANGNASGNGDGTAAAANVRLALPAPFDLPASLAFPDRASMLIRADRDGRADAIRAVQMVMSRLLVSLPPGRVRFTLLDPVGLGQNFAGFMHLADHDDQLVGGRIWTETDQIDHRLNDLTGHMETIIQKYLRNEFETIDDYNAQAGELAEPYRFLVVSDFPAGFTDEALRRLSSVASSGARCGVYTLIYQDTRLPIPHGVTTIDDLAAHSVVLELRSADLGLRIEGQGNAGPASQSAIRNPQSAMVPTWLDPVFQQFPLTLDPPPSELALTKILDTVGRGAKEAARVEVPFETIAPPAAKFWSQDSGGDLNVPVGRTGATRLQHLRLGKGVAQHVLIAGKTGSGKSTLLHALVTNLAMWYGPDQVEFYLVDFKKGVEFKTYATYSLPHARAIAVESDREFGISVLQRLDAELTRRGELFRAAGVQDLASYRRSPNPLQIPRTLLIVDEFQEFFSEDDKLAQDASVLLDRLVRQGRAFGIHCLLGSQTIAGASGLPRSTIGQMAVRIALMTSEADSQLILGDNNSAARLLSRPGEAIYNDQGGLVEGNSPFQVAYLSDERKDHYLAQVRRVADERRVTAAAPIVFEGNAPADLSKNRGLTDLLDRRRAVQGAPQAWVGEPVAIKEPTAVVMRRQSGANLLVIGQAEESAMATLIAGMISLAAQVPAKGKPGGDAPATVREPSGSAAGPAGVTDELGSADDAAAEGMSAPKPAPITSPRFYIFDATPADSSLYGTFAKVKSALPHDVRVVEWRATPAAINEIATEVARRRDEHDMAAPPVFLVIYGLQRYRVLRKSEDDFGGFSIGGSDEPKPADPGKQFAEVLKEGPPVGVHILAWADTATAVDRTLDRGSLREFDNRVLFQMSASDSSNLIDSPAANKLGFHRALAYSEEQGVMEKFRPYALPGDEFLKQVSERLGRI